MGTSTPAQTAHDLSAEQIRRIDAIFSAWDTTRTPGAAVGIYSHGELLFSRGYGMSNLEHGVPIRPDSIFHVASISKQFTATCMALLQQEGRINLDDNVRTYVPEVPQFGNHTITIRHLIHHTSGLRDQWDLLDMAGWRDDDLITDQDVLDITARQRSLNFAPGDDHLYCNTGYTLQGVIIKRVTGKSLREYAQEHIFGPLGMARTHFHNNHAEIVPGRTQAYEDMREQAGVGSGHDTVNERDGSNPRERYRISIPVFDTTGTTSLFTTVEDFLRWDQNYATGQVAGDLLELRTTPAILNGGRALTYAFGLVVDTQRGIRTFNHSGADAGYRAHYLHIPELRLGVTVFCNLGSMSPAALLDQVVDVVLGEGVRTPAPQTTAQAAQANPVVPEVATLKASTGLYRNLTSGALQAIVLDEGTLRLPMLFNMQLIPISEREFRTSGLREFPVVFDTTADGQTTFTLTLGPDSSDTYLRVADIATSQPALQPYVGRYVSDELDSTWAIVAAEMDANGERTESASVLHLHRPRHTPVALRYLADDTFISATHQPMTFVRDDDGQVNGLIIGGIRVREMRFERLA